MSVSLAEQDLEALDAWARRSGTSRSAAVQHAVRLLVRERLEDEYAEAFAEWDADGEGAVWDVVVGDGLEAPQP